MSTISCIIVSYNNEPYIRQAVSSVLDQSHPVDEIIIADDGSRDGTRAIIQAMANQHPVIRPLFRDRNLGVSANRDLAIRSASGELITTLDGDDWFFPDKIAAEHRALTQSRAGVAYSDIVEVHADASVKREISLQPFSLLPAAKRSLAIAGQRCHLPRDMLLSRQTYLDAGGLRHAFRLYEDWDFQIRLALAETRWIYSGVRGTAYRRSGEGLSAAPRLQHAGARIGVILSNRRQLRAGIGTGPYASTLLRTVISGGVSVADGMLCSLRRMTTKHA